MARLIKQPENLWVFARGQSAPTLVALLEKEPYGYVFSSGVKEACAKARPTDTTKNKTYRLGAYLGTPRGDGKVYVEDVGIQAEMVNLRKAPLEVVLLVREKFRQPELVNKVGEMVIVFHEPIDDAELGLSWIAMQEQVDGRSLVGLVGADGPNHDWVRPQTVFLFVESVE